MKKVNLIIGGISVEGFIPLSVPNLRGNEKKYINDAIDQEWVSTGGGFISDFEARTSEYVEVKHAVACQSGTAALHLSLLACGIGAGQEVIVPTLTFIAAVNPVRYVGAEPVFMDCDNYLCMDMDKLATFCENECTFVNGQLINKLSGKHIAAVLVVHVFGNLADMEKLMAIKQKYNLRVIEDATESLGSYYTKGEYAGKFSGTIGDIAAYSYNGNKIITTGGGGMVVSSNKELADRARHLSTQAKTDTLYFVHDEVGYNYRMTNVQAAMGLGQLEQLESFIEHKAMMYDFYQEQGINLLPFRKEVRSNYWFYSYMTPKRDELIKYLAENNVQSRPVWYLLHELKFYENNQSYNIQKAKHYWQHIVNIPCSTNLTKDMAKRVADLILNFSKN